MCLFRFLFLLLITLLFTPWAVSDSFRQVTLKHRNAASVQEALAPLTQNNKVAIAVDGNTLILNGASGSALDQLVAIIKTLDKPRKQLQISLFRGEDPSIFTSNKPSEKFKDQRWSTNNGQTNRIDTLIVEDGGMVIITENEWLGLPAEEALAVGANTGGNLQSPLVDQGGFQSRYKRVNTLLIEKGVTIVPVIVKDKKGKEKISVKANYSLPEERSSSSSQTYWSSSTTTVLDMNEWQLLSAHQQVSQRADTNSPKGARTKIVSTQKMGEKDYKVWVKFSLE